MDVNIVTITPAQAAAMLEKNPRNRNQAYRHIADMAKDMSDGRWQVNGDAIRVNGDGTLIDGQHRLAACVKAGVPFQTLLITGLSSDVMDTIDSGKRRSPADRLAIHGIKNAKRTATALRSMFHLAAGADYRATDQQFMRAMEMHPDLPSVCASGIPQMPEGAIFAVVYIGRYTGHEDEAADFMTVWKTGIPTYKGDPAHALRERHIRMRTSTAKIHSRDMAFLMASAWMKFLRRESLSRAQSPKTLRIPGWRLSDLGVI